MDFNSVEDDVDRGSERHGALAHRCFSVVCVRSVQGAERTWINVLRSGGWDDFAGDCGSVIATSMFLQVDSVHAWPRIASSAGVLPVRFTFVANRACCSKPQLYQRSSGLEKSFGSD